MTAKRAKRRDATRDRHRSDGPVSNASNVINDETPNHSTLPDRESAETHMQDVEAMSVQQGFGEGETAMSITRRIFNINRERPPGRATAIPDGAFHDGHSAVNTDRTDTLSGLLGCDLPNLDILQDLVHEYFAKVHWFSLVLYEPTFRKQLSSMECGRVAASQRGFIFLLATVAGFGAWYKSQVDSERSAEWKAMASRLLKHVEARVWELMEHVSLVSVQTYTLIGSYMIYHGKPNTSFALLGATVKIAQTLGLHRETTGPISAQEERKRVWWTIYTWDRFASITFGRPLGVNEKDCNVTMPTDFAENFKFTGTASGEQDDTVCYSSYQRELNKLYIIASPVIEVICGLRTSTSSLHNGEYISVVQRISTKLEQWKHSLPEHLDIELNEDITSETSTQGRIHRQQALALQQTLNYLIIVLYRPFLALELERLSQESPAAGGASQIQLSTFGDDTRSEDSTRLPFSGTPRSTTAAFSDVWWNAAVQTSRITELPQLAQLASDGHLVAFMAINLFNAAVVLVVLALSDPLSVRAQESKRYITKIYRMQKALGERSTLSSQSSLILKGIIRLLLRREEDVMLSGVDEAGISRPATAAAPGSQGFRDVPQPSVHDALALPLNSAFSIPNVDSHSGVDSERLTVENRAMDSFRLNESLASVQQAFYPSNPDDFYDISQAQQAPLNMHFDGDAGFGEDYAWNDTGLSDGQNDLFWMWNAGHF